jgi:hypothetical protein
MGNPPAVTTPTTIIVGLLCSAEVLEMSLAFAPVLSTPPVVPLLLPVLLARGRPTPELDGVVSGAAVMLVNSVVGLAVDGCA